MFRTAIITLIGLALSLAASVSVSWSHQPQVVSYKILNTVDEGEFSTIPDFTHASPEVTHDDILRVQLTPLEDFSEEYILVVFNKCGKDPKVGGQVIENLDQIIQNPALSPERLKVFPLPLIPIEDIDPIIQDPIIQDPVLSPLKQNQVTPGRIWQACPQQNAVLIRPSDKAGEINFDIDFMRSVNEGVSVLVEGEVYLVSEDELARSGGDPERLARMKSDEFSAAPLRVNAFYRLQEDTWFRGSFQEVFGKPFEDELGGYNSTNYDKIKSQMPVMVKEYRRDLDIPGSNEPDGGARLERAIKEIRAQGTSPVVSPFCFIPQEYDYLDANQQESVQKKQTVSHVLNGRFSAKWTTDSSLHPAFGWKAEAWTNEGGNWHKLGWSWVQSDSSWKIEIPASEGYEGSHLRMYYRAYNNYFEPQDRDNNTYSWKGPDRNDISNTHEEGHWLADCDGGNANGLGELYEAGMRMWSRLYWKAEVNPLGNNPITFFYPNTWDDCGSGNGIPWSCSSSNSAEIWLIPSHGTRGEVVTHELAHQLNTLYWNGKRPANSGGSHALSSCYPNRLGMTLREGFANFTPGWVGYQSRNVPAGNFNDSFWNAVSLESDSPPPNCSNGWENEVWVARTFWDLHDTHTDGDDILWFNHPGAVIDIYLNNPVASDGDNRDMRDYESIYKNAATNGHEQYIEDIFDTNRH